MINNTLKEIYGIPCWLVEQGYGSFITFEFGQPQQIIREPMSNKKSRALNYRQVSIQGQWHLWIYMCNWEIYLEDKLAAHSESSRSRISKALSYISGQKMVKVEIDNTNGNTVFYFDLGGLLKTKSYGEKEDEQWLFFDNKNYVLTIRSDGKYSYQNTKESNEHEEWKKLPRVE